MKTITRLLKASLIAVLCIGTAYGGFSSSSKSFGSSSSSSRSFGSSSKSYSAPSTKSYSAPAPKPSSWSSSSTPKSSPSSAKYSSSSSSSSGTSWYSKPQTSTRTTSKVEASRYQAAVKSGKAFTTRESAVSDFKTKYSSNYTSKFNAEPTKRPDYIPQTYRSGGNTYNVTYDRSYGGYGYWNGGGPGLGTFMLYDAMSDAIMMNTLMSRNNYYVGAPVVYSPGGFTVFIIGLLAAILIAWGLIALINRYSY